MVGNHRTSSTSASSMISKGSDGKPGRAGSTATALYFKQLRALLWKSFITRRVHYISTFFELIGPILLPLFLVVIYSNINPNIQQGNDSNSAAPSSHHEPVFAGPKIYETVLNVNFNEFDFQDNRNSRLLMTDQGNKPMEVLYAPNTQLNAKMVASLLRSKVQVHGMATEHLVQEVINKRIVNDSEEALGSGTYPLMGIVFDEVSPEKGHISYRLLVPSSKEFNGETGQKYPVKFNQKPAANTFYSYTQFVRVSSYVNRDYLRETCTVHNKGPNSPASCEHLVKRLSITRMPYPRYQEPENAALNIYDSCGLIIALGYVLVVPLIVKRITDEKDGKVKEMLRMIGMSDLVFWSSHFVSFFLILVVQTAIFSYLFFLMGDAIVQQSSVTFFFAFFLAYGAQLILFSMLITTIFNRPVIAVVVTTILWIVASALIFRFQVASNSKDSGSVEAGNPGRILTSFTPSGSLIFYFSILGDLENKGAGLGWTNFGTRHTIYGNFSVLIVLFCIMLSCLLYAFLIFYLDNVWPFQHGVPKSPFFICDPEYWRPKSSRPQSGRAGPQLNPTKYEPDPDTLNARISIQDLCKSFSSKLSAAKKPAVDHLWLNIYENQLTVLLGHNGAGKTTTMSMICGMFPSSSGVIYVNGYNVFTQTNEARRSIGLCPQENIYFNELTVGQHLRLFALLKDFSSEYVNKEVNYVLEMLSLKDKKNVLASSLSGGMKRKLALGIALIGDTETLILDEPTSGMDPEARRVIWDLLISLRRQRTILLTTHYMEEADVLADRIAILNDGHLVCSGSGLFLKNAFGTGYRLRVAKTAHFDSRRFEAILRKYVPAAKLVSEVETEVVYSLEEEKETLMTTFPALFNDIEQHRENYCIESCGLSYATLEDVFLKVGSDMKLANNNCDREGGCGDDDSDNPGTGGNGSELMLCKPGELTTGGILFCGQFCGLFLKRLHYARRSPLMILLQLLIPGAIIALALYVDGKIHSTTAKYTLEMNVEKIYGADTKTWFYGPAEGTGAGNMKPYFDNYVDLNSRKYGAEVSRVPSVPSSTRADAVINNWILGRANESFSDYLHSYLYGMQVEKGADESSGGEFNLWFNNEQYHSLPLSVVAFFEAQLRALLPDALKDGLSIDITSVPINSQTSNELFSMFTLIFGWVLTCLIFLPIAFPFLAASYVLYPIREQASKAKLIQLMTGLSPALYWSVNFLFDMINHLIATGVLFLIIYMLDTNGSMFGTGEQNTASALFLLIFSFGVATIPVGYAITFYFNSPAGGYVFVIILYLVFGLIGNIVFSVIHICNNIMTLNLGSSWVPAALWIFRAVPIFSMLFGYQKIYLLGVLSNLCKTMNSEVTCQMTRHDNESQNVMIGCCPGKCGDTCYTQASAFNFSPIGAGHELISLLLSGLVFFLLIVLYESQRARILRIFSMGLSCPRTRQQAGSQSQSTKVMLLSGDSDVEREVTRIEEEVANRRHMTDLLTVHKLKKTFGDFTAVDEISFGVKYDEVFGFLGVNGAGKTTTFSLLTGELMPTSGNAFIKKGQFSLMEDMQQFQKCIGLCPQFDALSPQLTGEEMLYLFGRLRGVPKASLARDVDNLVKMVGLEKHYTKVSENYSGGNRRKLSLAIALIGSPSLIFLDEPSAGVDPAARRKIWQVLGYMKRSLKCSVVLTSHSMEECEALCSRIAIMVNGKFRCLGSTQHLRSKYGQGYSVAIRLKREHESDTVYFTEIQVAMGRVLPSAVLKDCHQCLLHYHITDTNETWSHIFTQMNALNESFHFEDYFVSDTTLEAIFIMFARHQQTQCV